MSWSAANSATALRNRSPIFSRIAGDGIGNPKRGQKAHHLPGHLQTGHPSVEVNPVEALQIQTHVPIEDVVHGHHARGHRVPPGSGVSATPPACPHPTTTSPANPTTTSAVRGAASLVSDGVRCWFDEESLQVGVASSY